MNGICPYHQTESGKKAIEAEDMIAVKMAYEYMVYFCEPDPGFS